MWVYDPHSGGRKVPDRIKRDIERRIQSVAREHFAGKHTRLEIRFRSKFCYFDAYTEPFVPEDWPSAGKRYVVLLTKPAGKGLAA